MYFTWSDIYETGNELIDAQHRQIFASVNEFYLACNSGAENSAVWDTFALLIDYVFKHFQDEEELQRYYKYPEYLRHRQYHNAFRRIVGNLANRLEKEGPSSELLGTVCGEASDWLNHHIQSDDFVLAAYMRSISPLYARSVRYFPFQQAAQKVSAWLPERSVRPSSER